MKEWMKGRKIQSDKKDGGGESLQTERKKT